MSTVVEVKQVVAYAQTLRQRAEKARVVDPWVKFYQPSEAVARKLCQSLGGPAQALHELKRRAVEAELRYRESEEFANRARERHQRQLRALDEQLRQARARLPYGRRIDDALAKLSLISTIPASALDTDHVSGGDKSQGMKPDNDAMPRALTTARLAAESVEAELDQARRVSLVPVEPDRDTRLLRLIQVHKLTPEQVSIFDPSQGSASRVKRRLQELKAGS